MRTDKSYEAAWEALMNAISDDIPASVLRDRGKDTAFAKDPFCEVCGRHSPNGAVIETADRNLCLGPRCWRRYKSAACKALEIH